MREIRPSGSEGGETAIKAVFPTPIIAGGITDWLYSRRFTGGGITNSNAAPWRGTWHGGVIGCATADKSAAIYNAHGQDGNDYGRRPSRPPVSRARLPSRFAGGGMLDPQIVCYLQMFHTRWRAV